MPNDDREQQFERALTRHLRNASPDAACPDAEILAAYHERTLSLEEMAEWKEHIASCSRCQESLALVEQTEELQAQEWEHQKLAGLIEQAAVRSAKPAPAARIVKEEASPAGHVAPVVAQISKAPVRPPWRWILPLGALAASVVVWIGVREIRTQRGTSVPPIQVADNRQEPPQTRIPASRSDAIESLNSAMPPAKQSDTKTFPQKTAAPHSPRFSVRQRDDEGATPGATPSPAFEGALSAQKDLDTGELDKAAKEIPAPAPARVAGKSMPLNAPMPSAEKPPVQPGAAGGATVDSLATEKKREKVPAAAAETVEVQAAAPGVDRASAVTSSAVSSELPMNYREEMGLIQLAGADRSYIVSPGNTHAWHVDIAGKIARSTDYGKTWKLQKSGVSADLTSGSATSDKVCWVAGKAGTLLLTNDGGKHWKSIPSPIAEDLGGVHATDALHASIWDLPNRKSYETSDGGVTWIPASNE